MFRKICLSVVATINLKLDSREVTATQMRVVFGLYHRFSGGSFCPCCIIKSTASANGCVSREVYQSLSYRRMLPDASRRLGQSTIGRTRCTGIVCLHVLPALWRSTWLNHHRVSLFRHRRRSTYHHVQLSRKLGRLFKHKQQEADWSSCCTTTLHLLQDTKLVVDCAWPKYYVRHCTSSTCISIPNANSLPESRDCALVATQ